MSRTPTTRNPCEEKRIPYDLCLDRAIDRPMAPAVDSGRLMPGAVFVRRFAHGSQEMIVVGPDTFGDTGTYRARPSDGGRLSRVPIESIVHVGTKAEYLKALKAARRETSP
jgi:hypothetical protein